MEENVLAIGVVFDPDKQCVGLQFEQKDFRTWEFVIAVLNMAVKKAERLQDEALRMARMKQMSEKIQIPNEALARGLIH